MWQQWLNGILGLILFFTGIAGGMATVVWLLGIIIAALAFWSASLERAHMREEHHHAHQV